MVNNDIVVGGTQAKVQLLQELNSIERVQMCILLLGAPPHGASCGNSSLRTVCRYFYGDSVQRIIRWRGDGEGLSEVIRGDFASEVAQYSCRSCRCDGCESHNSEVVE